MNNKTTRNSILLLVTAAVWGAAFVAQTVGGQTIGAYSFNCVRCIIGALVLIPVMKFLDKKDLSPRKPQTKEDYKLLIKGGMLWCSTLYFYKLTAGWNFDGGKCGKSRFPDSGVYITGADSRIIFT